MEDQGGSWSKPGSGSPLQAAAAANATWAAGAGLLVSGRTQLVLEILMVLMCLGAVAGTESPADILFIF